MTTQQLGDVCEIIMGQAPRGDSYNESGAGVPLVAGASDLDDGTVAATKYTSAPTKLAEPGDVIVAIRASIGMRGDATSVVCLGRGVAALRAAPQVDRGYLWHWVGAAAPQLAAKGRGATFLQVSRDDIATMHIPLPPLAEQRRIAQVLDAAHALRAKRQSALSLLRAMLGSVFVSMFGDPVTNPRAWPKKELGSLGKLERGISRHRPRNAPELLGGSYPLIQTGDVARSEGLIARYSSTYSDTGLRQSRLWPAGTLCITIAANIAKTGVLTFDACFPDSVVGFTSNPATTTYIQAWLSFLQPTLERSAPESAQKNINLAILRQLPVPTPPQQQRDVFADRVESIRAAQRHHATAVTQLDALFASLNHRAFNGGL